MDQALQNKVPAKKTDAAPTAKTNSLQNAKTQSAAAAQTGKTAAAAERSQEQTASPAEQLGAATASKNSAEILSALRRMTSEERKAVAGKTDLMSNLAALNADDNLKASMDLLYEHIGDDAVMQTFVEKRYGVKLGTKTLRGKIFKLLCCTTDKEQAWTANGARHLYYSLGLLPQSHVSKVSAITTMNTQNGGGGVALGWTGSYNVNYTDSNTSAIAGRGYCDTKQDYKYDLNSLDCTMVHELGHIVDVGQKYSKRDDFRAISDWKSEGKSAQNIAAAIESYAANPYPEGLTAEEKEIAREGAKLLVKNRVVGDSNGNPIEENILPRVQKAYGNLGKRSGKTPSFLGKAFDMLKGNRDSNDYRGAAELTKVLMNSTVYKHIARSFTYYYAASDGNRHQYMPWYKGARSDMHRQIHEGYEGRGWYSFSNAAWAQKISMYQFRDPGEEFAELYASYHVASPKGSKTSAAHKEWFERMGLHQDAPAKTSSGKGGKF